MNTTVTHRNLLSSAYIYFCWLSGKYSKMHIFHLCCVVCLYKLHFIKFSPCSYADLLTPYMNSVPAVIAKASAIHNPIIYAITHPKYRYFTALLAVLVLNDAAEWSMLEQNSIGLIALVYQVTGCWQLQSSHTWLLMIVFKVVKG